jgi:threonine dehydrogenase-like Zn-dependent dehydrogenase
VRAVLFDLSVPRYLAARGLGRYFRGLYDGAVSCVRFRDDVPEPVLPGDRWVRLAPLLAGVCGTDLATVYFKSAPTLTPYASFPFVPGHEVVARVTATGSAVRTVREGDRVVVDPWLHCELRGAAACQRCVAGEYATCERAGTGPLRGMMLGASASLPGGWGEAMLAHETQLFVIPDTVSDARAVLAEPWAVGLHAALRNLPLASERVLVIGGGAIALLTVASLRELCGAAADITLLAAEPQQLELGTALGATRGWLNRGRDTLEQAAGLTGAQVLRPVMGPGFLAGGFDRVFDCVGSAKSLHDAMSLARAGATIVLVGAPGVLAHLDLTHLWSKELRVVGTLAYGYERAAGQRRRTFEIARELLQSSRLPVERLVTHRFPLSDFRSALRANLDRGASGAIKTVLLPQQPGAAA